MRRAWKLYDKCYREISAIGGPFLSWAPELHIDENCSEESSGSTDDLGREVLNDLLT